MFWQEVDREPLLPLTFCLGRNHYWENGSRLKPNDDGRIKTFALPSFSIAPFLREARTDQSLVCF